MNLIKKLIPNSTKQKGKYFLYDLLKMPYNKFGINLGIVKWLPNEKPITFIDIGASEGIFSDAISQFYKIKKGILIEPLSKRIPLLEGKFGHNDKYGIINMAIADKVGEAEFYVSEFDVLSSLLKIDEGQNELFQIPMPVKTVVKTDTLDNITERNELTAIDLIKMDVQGAEHLILASGINTLKITKLLFTEFSYKPMYDGSSTFFDLYQILNQNNFRLVNISEAYKLQNGELVQGDALFVNNALC
jgi:FkbM family methyltransferase